jgi:hypothetical protein
MPPQPLVSEALADPRHFLFFRVRADTRSLRRERRRALAHMIRNRNR